MYFFSCHNSRVAKGATVFEAVSVAKSFISAAIEEDLQIGNGHGPTNHWAYKRKGERV